VLDPVHVTASRDEGRLSIDAYDADELFHRAAVALRGGRCGDAVAIYERLVAEFPDSELVEPALYNTGLCLDQLGQHRRAAAAYREMIERFGDSRDVTDALFRLAGSYEELEAWSEAVEVFDTLLLERPDLEPIERIEALARKGSALLASGRTDEASSALEQATRRYRLGRGISPADSVFHYSMAQFKLGEIVHRRMRELELPPDERLLGQKLEQKAQLLLDAQRLYTKVIRIGHQHWAAAAAYRIGALYHHLWVDILSAEPPPELNEEEREVYEEILRERVRVLLEKALAQWERTLKLAIRLGLENEWVEKTNDDIDRIRDLLIEERFAEEEGEPISK
jgi:tetratricopeptide (TPR) repeat protein